MKNDIDILMITYNRAEYTRLTLARVLDTCDENMRVWVWHNGTDEATLDVVKSMQGHPNFYRFHHSVENKKLNVPTNWLWENAEGQYFSKVDDDCLLPYGWADTLRKAHEDNPEFGIIACWFFPEEDFVPELAEKKIKTFAEGHSILQNCWVGGSGYLLKREHYELMGGLKDGQNFSEYCVRLAVKGYVNGWYYPFLYQEHFDDPRSEHCIFRTEEAFKKYRPLSADTFDVDSVEGWIEFQKSQAVICQMAELDPYKWLGWKTRLLARVKRVFGLIR